jgi:hypothetical protein
MLKHFKPPTKTLLPVKAFPYMARLGAATGTSTVTQRGSRGPPRHTPAIARYYFGAHAQHRHRRTVNPPMIMRLAATSSPRVAPNARCSPEVGSAADRGEPE